MVERVQEFAPQQAADSGGAKPTHERFAAAGSIIGGVAAMSCCIVPLGLFSLGAGGAWIGNLTAVAPYQPYIIAVTLGFLGAGYYMVYRKPKLETEVCEPGSYCASPKSTRVVKIALWASTAFVAASIAFNVLAPVLLDY